jgi:hypothetical protein
MHFLIQRLKLATTNVSEEGAQQHKIVDITVRLEALGNEFGQMRLHDGFNILWINSEG